MRNTTFENNHATGYGGAIAAAGSCTLELEDVLIQDNMADGGGALAVRDNVIVTIRDSAIKNNVASWGGGMYLSGDVHAYLFDSLIHGNIAEDGYGGGATINGDTAYNPMFESDGCDWGSGGYDNSLYGAALAGSYTAHVDLPSSWFTCGKDTCYK